MKCTKHLEIDATGMCAYSGKPYCQDCLVEIRGKMYAKDNLSFVIDETKEKATVASGPTVFMNAGGGGGAAVLGAPAQALATGKKSRGVAIVLALFLGGIGAHKFYLGQPGWGILYLLFCWTFIPVAVSLFEALNYLLMGEETFTRRYG